MDIQKLIQEKTSELEVIGSQITKYQQELKKLNIKAIRLDGAIDQLRELAKDK